MYFAYFVGIQSAREFLLKLDAVHIRVTKPLKMNYKSERGLIDMVIGLAKGVGIYFKEDLKVRKISDNQIEVVFP